VPYLLSVLLIVSLVLLLLAVLGPVAHGKNDRGALYRSRSLMTENEREFFSRLEAALPEFRVFSQVAMSGVLDVTLPPRHPAYWRARSAFDKKRMDYLVCTRGDFRIVAAVELDDRSHASKKAQDAKRDAMLASAGIRTVRFPSHPRPDAKQIRELILGAARPPRAVA